MDLRYLTRRFLLGEAFEASPSSYFQSLMETLQSMNPATEKDRRKREVEDRQRVVAKAARQDVGAVEELQGRGEPEVRAVQQTAEPSRNEE